MWDSLALHLSDAIGERSKGSSMTKLKWGILAILIISLAYCGIINGQLASQRDRLAKTVEAALAREEGLVVASDVREGELKRSLGQLAELQEEVDKIRALAPKAEVKEVVRWRTKRIDVPGERLILPVFDPTLVPDCDPAIPQDPLAELPVYAFDVRGAEARIESRAGNLFAAGVVELWMLEPEEALLGTAAWESEDVSLEVVADKQRGRVLTLWALAGTEETVSLGLGWHRGGKRFGWAFEAEYDLSPEQYDHYTADRYEVKAGVVWRW